MFNRIVVVLMLMLFPFQWSEAQGHELGDDVGVFAVVAAGHGEVTQLLTHTDDPGGVCQFHELAKPGAMFIATDSGHFPPLADQSWARATHVTAPGYHSPSEIEKPKWYVRQVLAANS